MYIYTYIWLGHFAVQQKLTEHYKQTIIENIKILKRRIVFENITSIVHSWWRKVGEIINWLWKDKNEAQNNVSISLNKPYYIFKVYLHSFLHLCKKCSCFPILDFIPIVTFILFSAYANYQFIRSCSFFCYKDFFSINPASSSCLRICLQWTLLL